MIVKETCSLEKLVVVTEMPPLPAAIGDVQISRKELKTQYKTGHTTSHTWQAWDEPESTEAVVELLNRMWLERQSFCGEMEASKDADGGDLCPVQFGQPA